jgi:hypothetical protein
VTAGAAEPRHLQVVRGNPTPEEVAALVTVLSALAARGGAERAAQAATTRRTAVRSLWARPARNIWPPLAPSPDAWRASGFPR